MKFNYYRISILLLFTFVTAPVWAEGPNIGYVDTARILKVAPQAEVARSQLQQEFAPRDKKIVSLQQELKKLEDNLTNKTKPLSEKQTNEIEREIISLKRDIKRAREEFTEDFNIRRNEELTALQKLVYETIVNLAKDEKYDVILGDSALYASKRIDITDKVLDKLKAMSGNSKAITNSTQK